MAQLYNTVLPLMTLPAALQDSAAVEGALGLQAASAVYQSFRALPMIDLLPEPADCDTQIAALLLAQAALPNRLWTDAYLAALAHSSGARLVTFDRNFERFGLNRLLTLATD